MYRTNYGYFKVRVRVDGVTVSARFWPITVRSAIPFRKLSYCCKIRNEMQSFRSAVPEIIPTLALVFHFLQSNHQTSSWSITVMVVVGHGMRTGARTSGLRLGCATHLLLEQSVIESGQLSFESSWILLLNNNSRKLVSITDCSNSK